MTTAQFLDLVPWADMRVNRNGDIRHGRTGACPICAAFHYTGNKNAFWAEVARDHGIRLDVAKAVMMAADKYLPTTREQRVRDLMEARLQGVK